MNTAGHKVRTTAFKPYTWTRIYRIENADKEVFFTVGVDGLHKGLVYKLDYKYKPSSHLTSAQREICEKLIKQSPAKWVEITEQQLTGYNWGGLSMKPLNSSQTIPAFMIEL